MKNIRKLTNYELYIHIFNRIFGYNVNYPESWNIENILNGDESPSPFIYELYPDIVEKINSLKEKHKLDWSSISSYSYSDEFYKEFGKIFEENFMYEKWFEKPVFRIIDDENYTTIYLDYIKNYRIDYGKEVKNFNDNNKNYYIRFYDNGDISISGEISESFRNSFFDKSVSTYTTRYERFLSYNETLEMRKYFEKNKIDIQKEIDFVI